jgi:4-hydroxy-3-polyprenylbenzoate decarboxylase
MEAQRPQEILTQACAILGQGQLSLAKYLFIVNRFDDESLDVHDIAGFFRHVLLRVDWRRDLHFQTQTTIDTLDYSGEALNSGSKGVVAAAGPPVRELGTELPGDLRLREGWKNPRVSLPGVLVVQGLKYEEGSRIEYSALRTQHLAAAGEAASGLAQRFPLIVVVDDSDFVARSLANFLWVTFTRSNPAADIDGVGSFFEHKHWGCTGPLILDARLKPQHAPPLVEDV